MGGPRIAQAPRHRISISWPNECRDLFQIQFHKTSIFVHFRYQPHASGVMNRIELPPGRSHTFEVTDSADATTRKVKYSHPVDGKAHFSQDGGIVTTIRNQAERLDISAGHIFSLDLAGIALFQECNESTSGGTASAHIRYESSPPDPLHCAGFWLMLEPGSIPGDITNPVMLGMKDGEKQGLAIAPPAGSPLHGGVLVLLPRSAPPELAVEPGNFRLMFTGGLAEGLADSSVPSSFLALQYPVHDISTLRLVDFHADELA
jgi:hypothetical protein